MLRLPPGCSLIRDSSLTTSPLMSVEFCQSAEVSVLDTTYFGVPFM
jgi:hypothetical protein